MLDNVPLISEIGIICSELSTDSKPSVNGSMWINQQFSATTEFRMKK